MRAPGEYEQRFEPFSDQIESGSMAIMVQNETFARDVFTTNPSTGQWARLNNTADPSDATLRWSSTSDLDTSDTIYIGNEDTSYTGKTATTTSGHTRAVHMPFQTDTPVNFRRQYRLGTTAGAQTSAPYGSNFKRNWIGSWVSITVHRVQGDVVDTLAQAEAIFAGTIADIQEEDVGIRLVCVDALEKLNTAVLLQNQWSAQPAEGVYFTSAQAIRIIEELTDFGAATTTIFNSADIMDFDGTYIAQGYHRVTDVQDAINEWLTAENTAGRLYGYYSLKRDGRSVMTFECRMTHSDEATHNGSSLESAAVKIQMTPMLAGALGFDIERAADELDLGGGVVVPIVEFERGKSGSSPTIRIAGSFAYAHSAGWPDLDPSASQTIEFENGSFLDQAADIPNWVAVERDTSSGTWGFVTYRGVPFLCEYVSSTEIKLSSSESLRDVFGTPDTFIDFVSGHIPSSNGVFHRINRPIPGFKQFVLIQNKLDYILLRMLASTGDAAFNHATYDAWDAQLSIDGGIPWDVIGDGMVNSLSSLAARGSSDVTLFLTEPTRAAKVIVPELLVRHVHFAMDGGTMAVVTPTVPAAGSAVHTITTSHRDAPNGQGEMPDTELSKSLIVAGVTVEYDRNVDGDYRSDVAIINDQVTADHGVTKNVKISMFGNYSVGTVDTGQAVRDLIQDLSGTVLRFYGRPLHVIARSVAMSKAFAMVPGHTMSVTDDFVRDAADGTRGISSAPGWLLSIVKRFGEEGMSGHAQIVLHGDDATRLATYSPCALIDQSQNAGGYTGGYDPGPPIRIHLVTNEFTLGVNTNDVDHFEAGDEITVIERSPATPASPQKWTVTISSISGDDVTIDAALTGFDSTLEYYVIPAAYASVQTTQTVHAFMGDDADGQVVDSVRNFLWGFQDSESEAFTAASTAEVPDHPVTDGTWEDDGQPVTPLLHRNAIRSANILNSRKTAPQQPVMLETPHTTDSTTYVLAMFPFPIYVSRGKSFVLKRFLNLAPAMKQTTSGTGTVRVTLSSTQPVGSTVVGEATTVEFFGPTYSQEFTNTSTSYANKTAATMEIIPAPGTEYTWVTVEHKTSANTSTFYGLPECWLGELRIT